MAVDSQVDWMSSLANILKTTPLTFYQVNYVLSYTIGIYFNGEALVSHIAGKCISDMQHKASLAPTCIIVNVDKDSVSCCC